MSGFAMRAAVPYTSPIRASSEGSMNTHRTRSTALKARNSAAVTARTLTRDLATYAQSGSLVFSTARSCDLDQIG
ncbi:hypothetical protein [Nonomuraea sp. NPDC049129]|uniref:hypothetical protein n=1 Tax=Nonomuraea sp. NPDC049129 TaxID=3155272 RepID=UPI0033DF4CBD